MFGKVKIILDIGYATEPIIDRPLSILKRVGLEGRGCILVPWVIEHTLPPIIESNSSVCGLISRYVNAIYVDNRYYQTISNGALDS